MAAIQKDPVFFGLVVFTATFAANILSQLMFGSSVSLLQALSTAFTLSILLGLSIKLKNAGIRKRHIR